LIKILLALFVLKSPKKIGGFMSLPSRSSKVKLYHFGRAFGLPDPSPFCVKLEYALLSQKIEYEVIAVKNPQKSPKGKLPYIIHDGKAIADSEFALQYLEKTFKFDLNESLSKEERAISVAFAKFLEDHLYFALLYDRWVSPSGWKLMKKKIFGKLPLPLRLVAEHQTKKYMKQLVYMQGIGRHKPEEIHHLGIQGVDALSDFLGNKLYFMGDKPTRLDGIAYGSVASLVKVPVPSPVRDHLLGKKNLIDYCDRMEQSFFSHIVKKTSAK
jgi:Glutathione S-transferase N-terminal domain/Glutathione S-transferase, C-terminal domain